VSRELDFQDAFLLASKLLMSFVVTPVDLAHSVTLEAHPVAIERTAAAHEARQYCEQEPALERDEMVRAADWAPAKTDPPDGPDYPTLPELVDELINEIVETREKQAEALDRLTEPVETVAPAPDPPEAIDALRHETMARHAEELQRTHRSRDDPREQGEHPPRGTPAR
jgi:hypothetical protein